MYAARLRATRCMGCGGPMPEEGRIDRRYCRPGCRTLAYRMRLRTRGIEHGPTAVPRWAAGRLPELAQALTTLGRVQGNVTVLARQMECEEAAVRAWLLRLRALGEEPPDVPVPEPEVRLRVEADRLRADLDEALAQRNQLDEELRAHKAQSSAEITKLREALKDARKQTAAAEDTQRQSEQEELGRLRSELVTLKDELKKREDKLRDAEQERTVLRAGKEKAADEVLSLLAANRRPAPAQQDPVGRKRRRSPDQPAATPVVGPVVQIPPPRLDFDRMNEQVADIRRVVCLDYLAKARAQGQGEQVDYWLARYATDIAQAAELLGRSVLFERMAQDAAVSVEQAARCAHQQVLTYILTPGARFAPEFSRWFQASEAFLLRLTTALVEAVDARSSTDAAPARRVEPPVQPRAASSQVQPVEPRRSVSAISAPLLPEPVMPRLRIDPLTNLMRDKVQLLHRLAEYQEERGAKITGTRLDPLNETTLLDAAGNAAREARREFYFRSRGILSAIDPSWEVEGERLDPRSEQALFGEVMEQIDRLRKAVDKVKPKGEPW